MKKTYSRGKHLEDKKSSRKSNKKKVVLYIFLCIVCTFLIVTIPKNMENLVEPYQQDNSIPTSSTSETKKVPEIVEVDMPNEIENFEVVGELVIEKINFKNYILNKTTEDSLNFSVTKFYGPKVNQLGNFCITGHNTKDYLFKNLKELMIGDSFYIIDKENQEKVTYQVYDKYTVIPTDLKCLSQKDTKDKREVTLITCNSRRSNKTYC